MYKYYNEVLGFYESPFFRLKIESTAEELDLNKLDEPNAAVFIHEYIHFLQSITSIYGLNQIHIMVEYFRYANNQIYLQQRPGFFKVPIEPDEIKCCNVFYNWRIFSLTQGDSQDCDKVISVIPEITQDEVSDKCSIHQIDTIVLTVKTQDGKDELYSFGAVCIMESMAYILERMISPKGTTKSADLPYNSAFLVAKDIYPEFAENILNILALCDVSLQTSNPGYYYIYFLEQWKHEGYLPSMPDDIYDSFYKLEWNQNGNHGDIIIQLSAMIDLVKTQLFEYLKPDEEDLDNPWSVKVIAIRNWIIDILSTALHLRKNHRTFILNMAKGGNRFQNRMLRYIHERLGVPFCINKTGAAYDYHRNFQYKRTNLDYLVAIGQIYNTFKGEQKRCELFHLCKISGKKSDDALCETPWLMYKTETHLCPYAIIWHHWNLEGYVPDFQ